MSEALPMIPEQRHAFLLDAVRREGVVSIRALADLLGVSHMTVRRDIATLEASGQVVAVKGGVRIASRGGSTSVPLDLERRTGLELPRKTAIARLAAENVADGAIIYLDAGTTCQAMVPFFAQRNSLTVVTNDFQSVVALFTFPHITTIHTGGVVDAAAGCSEGEFAARLVADLNIDTYFASTAGWSISRGVSSPNIEKAQLKRAVLAASSTAVLVADSTKYGAAAAIKAFPLDSLDQIVTDDELSDETDDRIKDMGIELLLASAA
jgi:DeoR/GlpR family transcriptional regulator of sugar metabolism